MVQTTVATCHAASLPHRRDQSVRRSTGAQRQLGEHLVARPPPAPLPQVRLHEREVLDPPGRPLPGVEGADPPGRLRGPVEAAERDVRGEARAVGRRAHRARRIAYAARHRHEVTAHLLDAGPQHARGIRVREGAGSGEAQDERVAACCGSGERVGEVVEASLGDGPEEGEGDVPLVPVGPADLGAGLAPRLEVRLEVVEDVVGRDDGDEEPHRLDRGAGGDEGVDVVDAPRRRGPLGCRRPGWRAGRRARRGCGRSAARVPAGRRRGARRRCRGRRGAGARAPRRS